jgi:8-oxo-dGTP diphosphatase
MHKIFGERQTGFYHDRKGAYLIPIEGTKVAVIKTSKGFFFLGGGIDEGETEPDCIRRECLEEIGYTVAVGEFLCSGETYTVHPRLGLFHPIQSYYLGSLAAQVQKPLEPDHVFLWADYQELKGNLFSPMQNWALEEAWKRTHG